MTQRVSGIHHITAITADGQKNIDFYYGVLGLRLVKVTVNFDDPQSYHLYYGDELGRPGTIMTFFVWPGARRGRRGSGQATAISFSVPPGSFDYWSERLETATLAPTRFGEQGLQLADPDDIQLEIVAPSQQDERTPWSGGPVPSQHSIRGFRGVALSVEGYEHTAELLTHTLGFKSVAQDGNRFRFVGDAPHADVVDVLCVPDGVRGTLGAGIIHHVAFRTAHEEAQRYWRQVLVDHKRNVTPVIDRTYFHSIYFREPGGVLFEIATDGPGFTVDESPESLGSTLKLPAQYEGARSQIEAILPRLRLPTGPMP
jgi:catechol 2,3-dioxygenase-like lactoylglutathione lyase family enzyme